MMKKGSKKEKYYSQVNDHESSTESHTNRFTNKSISVAEVAEIINPEKP